MGKYVSDNTGGSPMVSVIMLTYNSAPFLPLSVGGVLGQKTEFDVQLVLSDDCSTDGITTEMCRRYARRHPDRITLLTHDTNCGIPGNFLDAYSACKGRYVAMCDADDYWFYSRKLAVMVDYMERHAECAVAFHRVVNYYEDTGEKSLSNGGLREGDYPLARLCRGNFITNCSVLYRRGLCPTPPAWVGGLLLCDYAMHLLHGLHGTIHYFRRPMAVYRKRSDALWTGVKAAKRLADALSVREKALALPLPQDAMTCMEENYTRSALAYLAEAGSDEAVEQRLMALHSQWGREDVAAEVERYRSRLRPAPMSRRLMSGMRGMISRLMPLPRVRRL